MTTAEHDIIVVVEGGTDAVSLKALKEMFPGTDVHFHIMSGDISTDWWLSRQNAVNVLTAKICSFMSAEKISVKTLRCIVQIMDTDGAFVPPENVVEDPNAAPDGVQYREDCMVCRCAELLRYRNAKKGNIMERLSGLPRVTVQRAKIPYRCFYMSRNLEHVLHNNPGNLSDTEKARLAKSLSNRKMSPADLAALVQSPEVMAPGDFKETWKFIQVGTRSLERHSNLHLAFDFINSCVERQDPPHTPPGAAL